MHDFMVPTASRIEDDASLGVLSWYCLQPGQVWSVGWARADPKGFVRSGTVPVDLTSKPWAAQTINRALGTAIVDRPPKLGESKIEQLYRESRVRPTWRHLKGGNHAVLVALSIPLTAKVGFMPYLPYLPASDSLPCEQAARTRAENLARIRKESSRLRGLVVG